MITPRPYQEEALDAIWGYFASGNKGNPLIAHPTGTGKSVLPAVFIERIMKVWPTQRFMMITHVKELIEQNYEVLKYVWNNAPVGIYSAGLKQKQTAFPIVYAGIQSAIKNPMAFGHRDLIFIDEAHLVSDNESSQYLTFLSVLRSINPHLKVIGMSATPFRMGMGMLTDGGLFTDIIHDITGIEGFNRLLADGYMAPLIPLRTKTELDVSGVNIQNHEFAAGQLQSAVDKQEITYNALRETCEAGHNRGSWLIFSSGIEHAEHIASMLGSFGIDCAAVHSKQKSDYNDAAIKAFKDGTLRSIVCFSKLTTGFNHPAIDLIVDLRPTLSVPLHVQKLGRGTRPADQKENCVAEGSLVLTDVGLIPIEKITLEMKLWDGIEYVSHNGIIDNGIQEVIEYDGLEATPNHKVWTRVGWKTFRDAATQNIQIAHTGNGRKSIREIESYFERNSIQREKRQASSLYFNRMSGLFKTKFQRILECCRFKSRLSNLWQFSRLSSPSKVVTSSLYCGERQMHQSKQSPIFRLWWKGNTIQISKSDLYGYMGHAKSWIRKRITYRQNKKQFALRSWKSSIFNTSRKYVKSKNNKICNKRVYDIINAGPRNRFTVNGLLVHNCLVLDFARNVPRLGPINDPIIPRKKGEKTGDIPIKICDACGAYNHISARVCCQCGAEFDFKVKIVSTPGNMEILRSDLPVIESYEVDRVIYAPHDKLGSPQSLKVTYFTGMQSFRQFICLEHQGLAAHKAREWWRQRHKAEPPATVKEALLYLSQLREPKRIRVWVNRKYPEIVGQEF